MDNFNPQNQPGNTPEPYVLPDAPPVNMPTSAPRPMRRAATGRDLVFAVICAILCILCADNYLWGNAGLGASISTVALLFAGIFYLSRYARKITFYGIVCLVLYFAGAASLAFIDAGMTKALVILLMIPLSAASILEFMDLRARFGGDFYNIADIFYTVFVMTFGQIGNTFYALFHKQTGGEAVGKRRSGSIILGLVISLPALLILIPLLKSSDAAFSNLIEQLSPKNLPEFLGAGILGLSLFVLLFGRMLTAPHLTRPASKAHKDSGAEPALIVTFLSVISAVYLLYLFSQLSYFFSAFSGLLPKDFTVAQYARRGFFEMVAVCALNLLIIFLANLICRKKVGKAPLAVRLLSAFFCVFSLVLAATSLSKLVLYVRSFGMTRLRIATSIFVVFLAVVFIAVLLRLFIKKVPYMKIALASAALLLVGSAYVNIDRVIAKYNVEAYLTGTLSTMDVNMLANLDSTATAPYLLKLTKDSNQAVWTKAKAALTRQAYELFEIKDQKIVSTKSDLRSWNLCTANTERLLEEHFDEYYSEALFDEYGYFFD